VLDGADLAGLTIRGASLRGDEHRYFGSPRQDSMGMWWIEEAETAALLVCATDGVGSQPLAHVGSRAACNMLPDEIRRERTLTSLFEADPVTGLPELCHYIAGNLARRLADIARYREVAVSPKAMSTTLVAAVVEASPPGQGQRRFVVFNVGDATAFLLRGGVFQPLLADPHDGVLMSTGTAALPTSIGHVATAQGVLAPGDMLLVCTDGISNPMRNGAVRDQLAAWWSAERIPGLPEFGWQMSFRVKSYGDDRTAVCVWGR
jgi:serine/threonine protein phosphatase PrpC